MKNNEFIKDIANINNEDKTPNELNALTNNLKNACINNDMALDIDEIIASKSYWNKAKKEEKKHTKKHRAKDNNIPPADDCPF